MASKRRCLTENLDAVQDDCATMLDNIGTTRERVLGFIKALGEEESKIFAIGARMMKPTKEYPYEECRQKSIEMLNKDGEFRSIWINMSALMCIEPGDIDMTVKAQAIIKKFVPDAKQTQVMEVESKIGIYEIPPELDEISKRIHEKSTGNSSR